MINKNINQFFQYQKIDDIVQQRQNIVKERIPRNKIDLFSLLLT